MKLLVCSSSREDISDKYFNDCSKLLEELFKLDNDLVFGANNKGLMRTSYEIATKYNREVIGINPKKFKDSFGELNCNKEIITNSIHERTAKLIDESDILLFLPGGIGTIYELFTAIESKRCGEFNKHIIIYNSNNYFGKLLEFMEDMYKENFTSKSVEECYHISNTYQDVIDYINYIVNYL